MMADEGLSLPDGVEWGTNVDADGNESSGLVVAGTPVGEPQFILNYVTSVVQNVLATITTVTDKLLSASANDHALQCMRLSFRNRVNFLQQVVVPTPAVLAQYQRLDDALDDATARIMGLDLLRLPGTPAARGLADPEVVAQRARLPARLRGTGHRRMVDVALAAFIGSMAMVIPRMPDRTDDNRDTIVGLFSHLVAVTGTGEDFQRKYEGSWRFSTFFRQADAIGIEMGTGLREAWETIRREVGDPAIGIFSVGAADLPGPPKDGHCLVYGFDPNKDVCPLKVQRGVTREREDARGEAICERYARLPETDPARLAFKAMGRTTALITLPNDTRLLGPQWDRRNTSSMTSKP